MTKKSEFGKGLCYNLGLFLGHEGNIRGDLSVYKKTGDESRAYSMWFYTSADHLFEFEAEDAPKRLVKRCQKFRAKVLSLRLPQFDDAKATKEDFVWAIQEAKDLLRLIDRANGIKAIKGCFE